MEYTMLVAMLAIGNNNHDDKEEHKHCKNVDFDVFDTI